MRSNTVSRSQQRQHRTTFLLCFCTSSAGSHPLPLAYTILMSFSKLREIDDWAEQSCCVIDSASSAGSAGSTGSANSSDSASNARSASSGSNASSAGSPGSTGNANSSDSASNASSANSGSSSTRGY
ncbi:hypothetical protein FHG87_018241 [Trinorchestia longiramus]|nr:hypothetical protein FHG87_018241 [Trinorchestia longiramus]